ncbi:MAG: aspartate/glutamate racemase family protein [Gammaproteobacteria bacterium]|nr:aspartate/glutamate racemase family protein [Gammaproteobacteria bacterium]
MKKTIGIVYAISEIAGAACYDGIIKRLPVDTNVLVYDDPQKEAFRQANKIIDNNEKINVIVDTLYTGISTLAEKGVDIIIISANSVHIAFEQLQLKVNAVYPNVRLLSIIDAVLDACNNIHSVAILGSEGTIKSRLYHKKLAAANIQIVNLLPQEQEVINNIISSGKIAVRDEIRNIFVRLKSIGCQSAILACTELSLLLDVQDYCDFPYVDSNIALANYAISALELTPNGYYNYR